jgi:divalent metal cation (Fe/Co/Zn/Cd) transporter
VKRQLDQNRAVARRAFTLEWITLFIAVGEAIVALISGIAATSLALVAFGADSVIEVLSAAVVLTQLRSTVHGRTSTPKATHHSHRLIAVLFFALALYVVVSAVTSLVSVHRASENALGFVVCIAAGLLMPVLAWEKRRTSVRLNGGGLIAVGRLLGSDAKETALCGLLSISTLVGIGLTAGVKWWWADPVASLVVVYFALHEGREAWKCAREP